MDIYFRQYWRDHRLDLTNRLPPDVMARYNKTKKIKSLALDTNFIDKIWKPDLFFALMKKGSLAQITRPNRLVRLQLNGEMFYSQRYHSFYELENCLYMRI